MRWINACAAVVMVAAPLGMMMAPQDKSDTNARARALAERDTGPDVAPEPATSKPTIDAAKPVAEAPLIEKAPVEKPAVETPGLPELTRPEKLPRVETRGVIYQEAFRALEKKCTLDAYGNQISCEMVPVIRYRPVTKQVPLETFDAMFPGHRAAEAQKSVGVPAPLNDDPVDPPVDPAPCPCGNPNCTRPDLCLCMVADPVSEVYSYATTGQVYYATEAPVAVYRAAPVATFFANRQPIRTGARVAGRVAVRVVTAPFRLVRGVRMARCADCE